MLITHPLYVATALISSFTFALLLKPRAGLKFFLSFCLPIVILVAAVNPLFNHLGVTILFYFNDNPVTAEAVIFGAVSALALAAVLMWFSTYNDVMTSDKFMHIFGRIIPKTALIISMTLGLLPKMQKRLKNISDAQTMIGKTRTKGFFQKIKSGLRILSILITWSLENGIETADSMKARGYGLRGRTSFSMYKLCRRDKILLPIFVAVAGVIIAGLITGAAYGQYYPKFSVSSFGIFNLLVFLCFALLCFLPIIIEITERVKWRYSVSKI
jgi:energy-coupling factor transport system permease protein